MAVQATAVWRVRPSGANTNGGGYDPGIAGAATDYSQQNAAQATGTHGSGSATTTFTDATAANFTSAMIGNAINIAGQGVYFVTAFTSATQIVVDRALGTFSGASWSLGGGWADYWTNTTSGVNLLVPGNTVYILGSGTPNPSSYTYDYTPTAFTPVAGTAVKPITFAGDPGTPGYKAPPDTTGGMPVIKHQVNNAITLNFHVFSGLYFVGATGITGNNGIFLSSGFQGTLLGIVFDQNNLDHYLNDQNMTILGCEVFSSVAGSALTFGAIFCGANTFVVGCNIHDCTASGLVMGGSSEIINTIAAKCRLDGITVTSAGGLVLNCTIDGNLGNGINSSATYTRGILNNIISNHTTAGKAGLSAAGGAPFADYNVYYNNTTDVSGVSYGPHDTHGGSNPYVGQSTENYTLA